MSTRTDRKMLFTGFGMLTAFTVILVLIFVPLFEAGNALNFMDALYNSVSKDSAYYIPKVQEENEKFAATQVEMNLALPDAEFAEVSRELLSKAIAGAGTVVPADASAPNKIVVSGKLGAILGAAMVDSDDMFHNRGEAVSARYGGRNARVATYTWWQLCAAMERDLNRQKLFAEAMFVSRVQKKAVECAYNYFGIEPLPISERWGTVVLSLIFYVFYTMWYGFAVMYLFAGASFRFEH